MRAGEEGQVGEGEGSKVVRVRKEEEEEEEEKEEEDGGGGDVAGCWSTASSGTNARLGPLNDIAGSIVL